MATNSTDTSIDCKEELYLVGTDSGEYKGYKQSLLVNKLNELETEFFVCTNCNGVMRNACQIGEDQICVCEMCALGSEKVRPILKQRNKILELKANCPLAKRGCEWNGTLSEVDTHLDVCQEFLVKCEYDCGVIVKRCEQNNHCSNECLNREVSCEHCQNKIVYRDLNRHYAECLEFPLLCPNNCGTNLRRKQTDSHIETDCPNTIVKCRYERFGCKEVVKRCEMEEHRKTNDTEHLEMTTFFAVNEIERLEERNTKLSKEVIGLTDKLEQLVKNMEDLEIQTVNKIKNMEVWMTERENVKVVEKRSVTIERVLYPVVLQHLIKESDFDEKTTYLLRIWPLTTFEISWRLIDFVLIFGNQYQQTIPAFIIIDYDKLASPHAKWPFEGRFKLTIVDRVNINNSLVYETPFVKLQSKKPEQGFQLKEANSDRVEITKIPRKLLLEDRFKSGNGGIAFTLQIQDAEQARTIDQMAAPNKKKELP